MLKKMFFLSLVFSLLAGCRITENEAEKNSIPMWLMLAKNNQEIRGIAVHISPEVPGAEKYYSLYSPYEINYVFTNDSIHVICFDSKGGEVENRWTTLKELSFNEEDIVSADEWINRLGKMNVRANQ
jgi:hypothetical protein